MIHKTMDPVQDQQKISRDGLHHVHHQNRSFDLAPQFSQDSETPAMPALNQVC